MPFPERKMVKVKEKNIIIEKMGYDEDKFSEDYWLYSDGVHPARIDKSAHQLIVYFEDVFKITNQNNFLIGDIGAGAGNMVNQFIQAGYNSEGCEYSESGRRIAKERFNINLKECDLRSKLKYNKDHFDWIYCVGVLSMIPDDFMENAIRELFRITKYGVLINVGATIANNKKDRKGNPHHLTPINRSEMWKLINKVGGYDWTSILPPQKGKYGIGVADEFSGLFGKTPWPF